MKVIGTFLVKVRFVQGEEDRKKGLILLVLLLLSANEVRMTLYAENCIQFQLSQDVITQ